MLTGPGGDYLKAFAPAPRRPWPVLPIVRGGLVLLTAGCAFAAGLHSPSACCLLLAAWLFSRAAAIAWR